jgi:protein-S-isoprenylcysteine O-methyltransferase Ste14
MALRLGVFLYGAVCYLIFFGTFLYAIGFIGNWVVPKTMDSGPQGPFMQALVINAILLGIFALQHSVMARQSFKRALTKIVPEAAERSTYVLMSSFALILLFWQWEPMGGVLWDVQNSTGRMALSAVYLSGILIVLVATFLINHFDLFGLRQVFFYLRGQEYQPLRFRVQGPYRHVRHPLYVGWLITFWVTPTMTGAHLLFALATTAYILIAIQFEEKDLVRIHGSHYENYKRTVPMIVPSLTPKHRSQVEEAASAKPAG